eukprot:3263312-Rhodomonas_salina.2
MCSSLTHIQACCSVVSGRRKRGVGDDGAWLSVDAKGGQVMTYYVSMLELFGSMLLGRNEVVPSPILPNAFPVTCPSPTLRFLSRAFDKPDRISRGIGSQCWY